MCNSTPLARKYCQGINKKQQHTAYFGGEKEDTAHAMESIHHRPSGTTTHDDTVGFLIKAVSPYKAISRYKAVEIAWSDRGTALMTCNEQCGFPLQGGHIALAHHYPRLTEGLLLQCCTRSYNSSTSCSTTSTLIRSACVLLLCIKIQTVEQQLIESIHSTKRR